MPDKQTVDDFDEASVTAQMLLEESDRGCAIFGAQMISDRMEDFFTTIFCDDKHGQKIAIKLLNGYGPLATFSARLDMGYALGAIPYDIYQSAQIVRKIRNRMAHERGPVSFDHPQVGQLFRLLVADGKPNDPDEAEPVTIQLPSGPRTYSRQEITNRVAYIIAVSRLLGAVDFNIAAFRKMSNEPLWIRFLQSVPPKEIENLQV